ncbi:MAG: endolytic transglycosylase MltG [Syntrophorhabdales bacterium]|jgi:UPF0755 protein
MPRGANKSLLVLAILIAAALLPVVFATMPRGKNHVSASFVVKKGTKIGAVAHALKEERLVLSEYLFLSSSLLAYNGRVVAGEYELSDDMSALRIARKMAHGERRIYTLKIVEGYNLYTIGDAIRKAGVMDGGAFLRLARRQDFLVRLAIPSDSLEGYLFPDTYFFSKETGVDEFLEKIVLRTFKFFEKGDIKKGMQELNMTMFQALSLASIIEKEAKLEREKGLISAVFHNRLRLGMSLDADPTVIYGRGAFNRDLRKADLSADTPYNTYRLKGLPKGPICSPSKSSIMAALYPEPSDMLYFVSRNDGSHVFSRTMREHQHFVQLYQRNKNRKQ